ncbi:MAG: radical SAM protein [Ruminococcaceae bacterium]|nr:radical SAM protein [Oscillospiraceae bacterium]
MKTLFIIPPQWYPMNAYLSAAQLVGQLQAKGFDAKTRDLNIEFFNDILKKENVISAVQKAEVFYKEFRCEFLSEGYCEEKFSGYSRELKTKILRYIAYEEFLESGINATEVADKLADAIDVTKNKERFYDPEQLFEAKEVLKDALRIISLPYMPSKIMLENFIANPVYSYDYADTKLQVSNPDLNMFVEYFDKKIKAEDFNEYSIIGISIFDLSQIIPGLTLAKYLKERTGAHITLGGNYIYKIRGAIKNLPEFFDIFCDSVQLGDGEIAAVKLVELLKDDLPLEGAYSLMYKDSDGTIRETETAPLLDMDALAPPCFDGYDFDLYFSADKVIPVQLSKSCYWAKCTFCDFYTGQQCFDIKSVKSAVDEIQYLVEKYGFEHFIFVDEAVPPKYYNQLATEIIKRGIKIYFYSFARMERGFTKEVLQNLYNAGARFFCWGYEAESERVMKLLNKGIDCSYRKELLENAKEVGLWNHCTFLLGYPGELPEETQATKDVICNRNLVDSCTPSNFALKKNAIMIEEVDKAGLNDIKDNGDFHISCNYMLNGKETRNIKKERMDFQLEFLKKTADSLWSIEFTDTDHILLYTSKYGAEWVRNYRLKYKKHNFG